MPTVLLLRSRVLFKAVIIILVALTHVLSAQSELIHITSIGVDEGLPTKWSKSVVEDNNHLLWIGTHRGISRYDGYQLLNFDHFNSSLRANRSNALVKDGQGRIWSYEYFIPSSDRPIWHPTFRYNLQPINIDIIDPKSLEIIPFDTIFKNQPIQESDIRILLQFHTTIWIVTKDGHYYQYTDQLEEVHIPSPLKDCHFVLPGAPGTLWGIHQNKLYNTTLNPESSTLYELPKNCKIQSVTIANSRPWILASSDSTRFDPKIYTINEKDELIEILLNESEKKQQTKSFIDFTDFQVLHNGDYYWIRFGTTIGRVNQDYQFSLPFNKYENSIKLSNYINIDSYGNLLNSSIEGIKIINLPPNVFKSYLHSADSSIETRGIIGINDSIIWVFSYKGTYEINTLSDTQNKIKHTYDASHSTIVLDSFTILLTQIKGLVEAKFNQKNTAVLTKKYTFQHRPTALYNDQGNAIYLGTENGLYLWNNIDKKVESNSLFSSDISLSRSHITYIYKNDSGLWVAALDGMYFIDIENNKITHYNMSNGLPIDRVLHITERAGIFWLSTNGRGLIKWDSNTNETIQFTTANGLSNNFIHASYWDDSGFLWLSSDNGLMRFDPETYSTRIYRTQDGIREPEFNRFSHFKENNGTIYFGSVNGITSFNPEAINQLENRPYRLLFTKFDVFNEETKGFISKLDDIHQSNALILKPGDSYLDIDCTLTNFTANQNILYAYQIEGLSDTWRYSKRNNIQLGQLPYGSYTLKIKGQGVGGFWAENELSLPITIEKPFYLKSANIIAAILLLLVSIYAGIKWRLSLLQKSNLRLQSEVQIRTQELHEVNKSKDKLFGVLAHDLRGPISSFKNLSKKVQYLISKEDWDTLDSMTGQINRDISRLDQLISNLLPWILVQSKNPELIKIKLELKQIVKELLIQYEGEIQNKGLVILNELPKDSMAFGDSTGVRIIIRNLLTNAIKFSKFGGCIKFSLTKETGFVLLEVQDNGIGIPAEQLSSILSDYTSQTGTAGERGHGMGLKLSRDLAVRNGGSLSITSDEGIGTTVTLKLPKAI